MALSRRALVAAGAILAVAMLGGLLAFQLTAPPRQGPQQGFEQEPWKDPQLRGTITGGGSTFVNPQMQLWAARLKDVTQGRIIVNYQSIGSGAGEAKWLARTLDFGASDVPISKKGLEQLQKERRGFVQFPVIVGSIAVIYNVPEWDKSKCGPLLLTPEIVAEIYLGEIITWNDPKIVSIQKEGCGKSLPDKQIIGVHRSDGSGTTAAFTLFLSVAVEKWKNSVGWGYTVEWPRDKLGLGLGGRGNEGVAAEVERAHYSIGYVELNYAITKKLNSAALRNKDGRFVQPDYRTVTEAAGKAALSFPSPDQDWNEIAPQMMYREGPDAYPIVTFVYIYLDKAWGDRVKMRLVLAFMKWILTEGQEPENVVEGYIALPRIAAEVGLKALQMLEETGSSHSIVEPIGPQLLGEAWRPE